MHFFSLRLNYVMTTVIQTLNDDAMNVIYKKE